MAMKYTKVLKYMQENGGRVSVDPMDPKLSEILGTYKVVGAMSAIRRLAKLDVRPVRNGRKAIAYELVATAVPVPAPVPTVPTVE
jgi:hypothetical protein